MKKLFVFAVAFLGLCSFTSLVRAEAAPSKLSIDGELDYTSAYFFRGTRNTDGPNLSASLNLGYVAYETDSLTLKPFVNVWGLATDESYSRMDHFYELDATVGVEATVGSLTLAVEYLYYSSPGDAFDDVHELGLTLSLDNKGFLNPSLGVYREVKGDRVGGDGTYLEVGIAPSFDVGNVSMTVPVKVGMSLDNYFTKSDGSSDFLGYGSVGVVAIYPLNDNWHLSAGVEYLRLFSDDTKAANNGDRDQFIGTLGVGFAY